LADWAWAFFNRPGGMRPRRIAMLGAFAQLVAYNKDANRDSHLLHQKNKYGTEVSMLIKIPKHRFSEC
jgi:hypothetical protein